MKNLVSKLKKASKVKLNDTLTFKGLGNDKSEFLNLAYYRNHFTKLELKKVETLTFGEFKKLLVSKIKAKSLKSLETQIDSVNSLIGKNHKIVNIKISVEWVKSKTWGANPTAEVWLSFINSDGNFETEYFKSRSVTGCGYDKESTAISEALNCSEVLKANLYQIANKTANKSKKNRDIFGYGSGYGVLPYFESGCGVSVYRNIFNALGLNFESVTSGKMFDVYQVTRLKK